MMRKRVILTMETRDSTLEWQCFVRKNDNYFTKEETFLNWKKRHYSTV